MTDLEKYCVSALRLSDASAEALLDTIKNHISIAKADMVRCGISEEYVEDEHDALICNAITKYVVSEMASVESERDKAKDYYKICLDELRKSYV